MSTTFSPRVREQCGASSQARPGRATAASLLAPAAAFLSSLPVLSLRRIVGLVPVPGARTDGSTGLPNESRMLKLGEDLLARARTADQAFTVAIFDFADLVEARSIYGAEVRDLLLHKLVRELRAVVGRTGVAGRTGKTEFTLVFPGLELDEAHDAIRAALGRPACVEFEIGGDEIMLVPDILVQDAGTEAFGHSFARWHARARATLKAQQNREILRRRRIQRDRERHSRPMPVFYDPAGRAPAAHAGSGRSAESALIPS